LSTWKEKKEVEEERDGKTRTEHKEEHVERRP
jgi:hypothetical protein